MFKDHLVTWVCEYLIHTHGKTRANEIIGDIDRWQVIVFAWIFFILIPLRISAVPLFPGLRRFPDGRDFKQWTGDDSKALMKVSNATIFVL